MRIGYFGDGRWSHEALQRILRLPEVEVAYIVARFVNPDPVLRDWAEKLGIPFFTAKSVNAPEFLERIAKFSVDVNVSMSFDQILKRPIIDAAPMGFINCHAGALPFYRGRNILNWALINGADSFGVTVHYVDEGIDTGDIIAQCHVPIDASDDYAVLLQKAVTACAELLPEALSKLASGTAQRTAQGSIHPLGFYCGKREIGDEILDWSRPSREIVNFVRALVPPGPGARTARGEDAIAVLAAETIPGAPSYIDTPGRIVGRDSRGIVVKTADSTVRVTRIAAISADGIIKEPIIPSFPIGTRLGSSAGEKIRLLEERVAALEALCQQLLSEGAEPPGLRKGVAR